jgi:hypothetical protein
MTVMFGTPLAALIALVGIVPLAVALQRARTGGRLRAELALPDPPLRARLVRPLALASAFGLLGLAAAQPSIREQHARATRTDAQLLLVLDSSRSMLAASTAGGTPRYRRAIAFAQRLHRALPELAVGLGSLNNRVLPYLFPTVDDRTFSAVLSRAYGIGRPPPAPDLEHWVTSFDELGTATVGRFFSPGAHKRLMVVLSDAETRPFDAGGVLRELQSRGVTPVVVRFWRRNERIFRPDGSPESYHATQADELRTLRAAGWQAYPEARFETVVRRLRRALGSGPVATVGYLPSETSIAPMIALAALAPFLLVLAPAGQLPRLPRRRRVPKAGPALLER